MFRKSIVIVAALAIAMFIVPALADSNISDFESPEFNVGSVDGQDGWMSTGPFDQEVVVNTYGIGTFGSQSLRVSNAVTKGSFGDQTFATPLNDAVGEADATAGSFSEGTRQTHFEMQFEIASTDTDEQPGLFLSVSPDRGDGSRMSYLGFADTSSGIAVTFYDVQGTSNPANFVPTALGELSRTIPHTIKLEMDVVDGPSNDVVNVYIDGALVHTGTSWENYYRYDSEASAEQSPRIVKTLIIRASGPAAIATDGNGFLFDNVSLLSGPQLIGPPQNKDECKKGGWQTFNNPTFKNQGDCVSYVNTH